MHVPRRTNLAFRLMAIGFVIGVYLDIPTSRNGIPMVSALPFAVIAALVFLRSMISIRVALLFMFGIVLFVLSLGAPDLDRMLPMRLLAGGQALYSFFIGIAMFFTVSRFSAGEVVRFLEVGLFCLLGIMVLEIFTPLSKFMDDHIVPLHGMTQYLEVIGNRDQAIGGGFRRPKAFTSETSFAAFSYTIGVCILAWLSHRNKSLMAAIVLAFAGVVALRSPIALVSVIFVGYCALRRSAYRAVDSTDLAHRMVAYFLMIVPVLIVLAFGAAGLFTKRLETMASGDDYSTIYRTYGSVLAAWATVKAYPVFGVGIGSIDLAKEPLVSTFISLGVPSWSALNEWRWQVQNLPSALFIYLGVVGTTIYCAFMWAYAVFLSGKLSRYFWMLFLLLGVTTSAFYAPRMNAYLFLLIGVNAIWNRTVFLPRPVRARANLEVPGRMPYDAAVQ